MRQQSIRLSLLGLKPWNNLALSEVKAPGLFFGRELPEVSGGFPLKSQGTVGHEPPHICLSDTASQAVSSFSASSSSSVGKKIDEPISLTIKLFPNVLSITCCCVQIVAVHL